MNRNLRTLSLAIISAVNDEELTSDQVLETIKDSLDTLSVEHRAKAIKADTVASSIKTYTPTMNAFDPYGIGDLPGPHAADTISFGPTDTITFGDTVIHGGAGQDTISL